VQGKGREKMKVILPSSSATLTAKERKGGSSEEPVEEA